MEKQATALEHFTHRFVKWMGSGPALILAIVSLGAWIGGGWFVDYSPHWENFLTIYIGSITFILIFVMQRTNNKELMALHVKLDELISADGAADEGLKKLEQRTEKEIESAQEGQ